LGRDPAEKSRIREFVIGGIHGNGAKCPCEFREAVPFETRVGESTTPDVAITFVNRPKPPGIFPRGCPKKHAALGEMTKLRSQKFTVEDHGST